jgi:hypothetical protein
MRSQNNGLGDPTVTPRCAGVALSVSKGMLKCLSRTRCAKILRLSSCRALSHRLGG